MPFLTVIVALLSFFAGFFVLLGFFVGATVGLAVGVALVPGAGVASVPGAGVDSAGAGANFRLSIVHCSPVKERYAFFHSSTGIVAV